MNIGACVQIVASNDLTSIKLNELAGRKGIIDEDLSVEGRKNKGYMVKIDGGFLGEDIWFIPASSVIEASHDEEY